jgi:NitT/TauT family transport system ATP-binding protein
MSASPSSSSSSISPSSSNLLEISAPPLYRRQAPEVAERFRKLQERPVILEVRALSKTFEGRSGPVLALDRISFRAHRREFLCIIGPSGCGKSTMARMIAGLDRPSSGEMLLDGHPVDGPGPDRGMVFQGYTLFPWLTVRRNIMFGPQVSRGLSDSEAAIEADEWIEIVGLSRFADSYPHQLSGGMKQRVAIARALANRPRILVMDEPFGALDAQTRAQMQAYLLQIWKQVDITVVFITHDLDEAIYLADRVLILDAHPGRVRELMEVPVPRPRTRDQLTSTEFTAARQHLDELIHPPAAVAVDTEATRVRRMTVVGDDVE